MNLRGASIVITGASSGFGKGAALEFAKEGARLALAARRADVVVELAGECTKMGARAIAVQVDVSKQENVEQLAERAVTEFGRIDVWVNNAGAGAIGRFEDVPLADHIQVIATDLLGTLYGSYSAMHQFHRQGRGTLINVSSVLGEVPMPYYSSYVAAKHGVNGLSASLRAELEQAGIKDIRVCTLMPTSTDTPFFEHAANYSGHEFKPTPPVYEPEDVVQAIVKLAADPEDELAVGSAAKLAVLSHNLAPGLTESMLARQTHKTLMEKSPPATSTEGAVHEPVPAGTGIKGHPRR